MSHQVIIIRSSSQQRASGNGTDEIEVKYTPPHNMRINDICKEIGKRLRWIEQAKHMDAAED